MKLGGNGAPKGDPNKKKPGIQGFLQEYKKQIVTTAIIAVVCFIAVKAAQFGKGIFHDMKEAAVAQAVAIQNEIDNIKTSDAAFTQESQRKDYGTTRVEWVGTQIDTGRWSSDEEIFWEFISPAFSFDSATEYNKMREDYISQLGNCLFTVQFLSYYDIESKCRRDENGNVNQVDYERYNSQYTCYTDKSKFITYPVGLDADGNYSYVALVPMQTTYVMFTYRVVHGVGQGGRERITLADFDCWPPNNGAKMSTGG